MEENYVQKIRKCVGHEKIILNAAGGIIVKDNKVLFQRRSDNNKWSLIGGILELNETYLDGAIREIKEETGLDVKPLYFLGIYHSYNMEWVNKDKAHVIGAYYVFEVVSGEPRIDEESFELRFFSIDEAPELFAEDHKKAYKAFVNGVKYPLIEEK